LQIRVSEMSDPRYEMLLAQHELLEALAAWNNNVPEPEVTKFDLWYEEELRAGRIPSHIQEPGFHPRCPYQKEHMGATAGELLLAVMLDVDWSDYDAEVIRLSRGQDGMEAKLAETQIGRVD
jgi:hypothetical protein